VHWSDESQFTLFRSDGQKKVYCGVDEKLNPNCVTKTIKFNGGSVMFWGWIS
jgi:hypothetical protein